MSVLGLTATGVGDLGWIAMGGLLVPVLAHEARPSLRMTGGKWGKSNLGAKDER